MERLCLLIDNENQDTSAEKIIREGKSKGLAIQVHQFNVGHPELTEVLESGKIDITKVIDYYNANFRKFHYDIIAFDWDLNDEKIDGVELIRSFRSNNLIKKTTSVSLK